MREILEDATELCRFHNITLTIPSVRTPIPRLRQSLVFNRNPNNSKVPHHHQHLSKSARHLGMHGNKSYDNHSAPHSNHMGCAHHSVMRMRGPRTRHPTNRRSGAPHSSCSVGQPYGHCRARHVTAYVHAVHLEHQTPSARKQVAAAAARTARAAHVIQTTHTAQTEARATVQTWAHRPT